MCQFAHEIEVEPIDEESDENADERNPIKQCHLCLILMNPEDNLVEHMEMQHKEYFEGMMEATAEMTSRC